MSLLYLLNRHMGTRIERFLERYSRYLLVCTLLILLSVQIYCCYGGYFISGWDAGSISETVFQEFSGEYDQIWKHYYSLYPNNIFIVWLYLNTVRVANWFGLQELEFSLVILQCVLDVITIWLVWLITYDTSRSYRITWLAYGTAYLFVGISPWFIVAYSDATGIVFPVLILRLYQIASRQKNRIVGVLDWGLIGVTAIIGYCIKPQIIISLIAVTIMELLNVIGSEYIKRGARLVARILACTAGILLALVIYHNCIIPSLHIDFQTGYEVGWQHFFMMGLNEQTDGVFAQEDSEYVFTIESSSERNTVELTEAKRRLNEMGIIRMIRHLNRKQLVNYGDGTFAWAVEGHSFEGDPEWAQNKSSNVVRSLIKPDGENYQLFLSSKQLLWVMILVFQLGVAWKGIKCRRISDNPYIGVMVLAVLGVTAFELLFEARARYLFCYSPIFVILSAVGCAFVVRDVSYIHTIRKDENL